MNDGVGGGEIQADAAGFQADQEDWNRGIALEAIHDFLTLFGRAVEIAEWNLELLQAFANEVQHRRRNWLKTKRRGVRRRLASSRSSSRRSEFQAEVSFRLDADEAEIAADLAASERKPVSIFFIRYVGRRSADILGAGAAGGLALDLRAAERRRRAR